MNFLINNINVSKMSNDIRKVMISGNLTAEPEYKMTKTGKEYMTFRIGSNTKDKETFWARCTCFEQSKYEHMKPNLHKGSSVFIIGNYSNSIYINNKNNKAIIDNEIIIDSVSFYGNSKSIDNQNNSAQTVQEQPQQIAQEVQSAQVVQEVKKPEPMIKPAFVPSMEDINRQNAEMATASFTKEPDDDLPF